MTDANFTPEKQLRVTFNAALYCSVYKVQNTPGFNVDLPGVGIASWTPQTNFTQVLPEEAVIALFNFDIHRRERARGFWEATELIDVPTSVDSGAAPTEESAQSQPQGRRAGRPSKADSTEPAAGGEEGAETPPFA